MDDVLTVLIVVGGLFVLIGFTADAVAQAAVRRRIAGKDLTTDQIEALLRRRTDPESVLKWALLTTTVGLAFLLVHFLPPDVRDQPLVVGLVLIFAGGALFFYRAIARRRSGE